MEGFVVHACKPTARKRRNAGEVAARWGIKFKHFYTDRSEAERDAQRATETTGIRFEVLEAEGL